ncbi:hypothetical protein LTR56_013559 [Elasticomyces elasticus]|nr:hypothetical protein LTR56_013559 [Elasticomyces elasticus]KAK3651023.1 hypothetical protein LTR22_012271 [Elasticomyces elasticus]KAK4931101.1 hypothetical protein LTR49_002517 [Elasticomyces elasticus]KAK5765569.1 hypothetical protein LTS12_004321 [Elasticomyces elasticus]
MPDSSTTGTSYGIDGVDYYVVHGKQSTGPEIASLVFCSTDFELCAVKGGEQSPASIPDGEQHVTGFRRKLESRDDASYTTSTVYATTGRTHVTAVTSTASASALRTPSAILDSANTPANSMSEASTGTTVYYGLLILLVFLMWWAICCVTDLETRVRDHIEDQTYYRDFYHQGRGARPTHPEMQKLYAKVSERAQTYKQAAEMTLVCKEYLAAHMRLAKEGHQGIGPRLLKTGESSCGCTCPYDYQSMLDLHPNRQFVPRAGPAEPYAIVPGIFAFFITTATCLLTLAGNGSGSSFDVVLLRRFIYIAGPVVVVTALPFSIMMRKAVGEVQFTTQTGRPASAFTTPVDSIIAKPVVQESSLSPSLQPPTSLPEQEGKDGNGDDEVKHADAEEDADGWEVIFKSS